MNFLPNDCLVQILEKVLAGINYFRLIRVCHRWESILNYILPYFDGVLNFTNFKITDNAIRKLKGIRNINLSYCYQITTTSLSYLTNVQHIDLTNCYINGIGFKNLTKCQTLIFKKPNGEQIYKSETITSLTPTLTSLSLYGVNFSQMQVDNFSHLVNLTELSLLRSAGNLNIEILSYFTNLESLTLEIENSFWQLVNIKTMDHLYNIIYPEKIKNINISYRYLNGLDLSIFTNLKKLKIQNNFASDINIKIPFKSLGYLDISNCSLKDRIAVLYAEDIAKIPYLVI